jgi:hypothetical protein
MSFADANRTALRYIKEATWGVTPTGPLMQDLNFTSESLNGTFAAVTSDTIRSDRNISDITQVGGGAGGDVNFELRYSEMDALIEAAMLSQWATTLVSAAVASCTVSASRIKCDSSALNNVVVDQHLRVTASVAANNLDVRVTVVSTVGGDTVLDVVNASSGAAVSFTSEIFSAGAGVVQGKMIRNGVTNSSFTLEKEFADVSAVHSFTGSRVGSLSLSFESQSILTGTIGFNGKGIAVASATLASATVAATTNPVMNASGNVGDVWEGSDVAGGICFQSFTIDISNNNREQAKVGSQTLAGIAAGRCEVTGSMTAYFENNSMISKFVNDTNSSFRTKVTDSDGNSYLISIPNTKYTAATIEAGGVDSDVVQDLTFGAIVDSGGTYAVQIDALD